MSQKTKEVISGNGQSSTIANYLTMNLLGSPEMSLRRTAHYIKRLNILLKSINTEPVVVFVAIGALVARAYDSENCFKLYRGEFTDDEFVNSLFKKIGMRRFCRDIEGAYIAVILISAQFAMRDIILTKKNGFQISTLLQKYQGLSFDNDSPDQDEREYAINVIKFSRISGSSNGISKVSKMPI